jgi:hypothetical protein
MLALVEQVAPHGQILRRAVGAAVLLAGVSRGLL